MAHDVFISYSSHDKQAADAVVAALEAAGMPCWIAPRNIHPGVEWSQAIVEAIRASRLLLLVFTDHSNQSPQVLREIERAVSLRVPIIPFRLENVPLTPSMEYFISVAHWMDALTSPLENHLPALIAAARERMAPQAPGAGLASTAAAPKPDPFAPAPVHTSVAPPAVLGGNLPSALTPIIGRESEVGEVGRLLATTRLLTLVGIGGCGKSRLALEAAHSVDPAQYLDGAWLVELGSLSEPELVDDTVADALHLTASGHLAEDLREKRLLLVLDNCEHLLGACATLVEHLLKTCPHLRILATSREPFNLGAEQVWRVPSLALPDPRRSDTAERVLQSPAVRFFVQRAQFRNPRFAVTDANARAVAEICRRLDGIPLALELAAARVRALPVEQVAQRLEDQFRLLAGGDRTALPQHQTLRAMMDWSFQLLDDGERAVLRRLSVFGGGWSLEAAEAICPDGEDGTVPEEAIETWEILDYLSQLVDKSLVALDEPNADEEPSTTLNYRLLETVRAYAREKLREAGEEADWRARHARYFRDLALEGEEAASGPENTRWQARVTAERDNLRLALDELLARGAAADLEAARDAARMALALIPFWARVGAHREARGYLEKCLVNEERIGDMSLRAHLHRAAGWFAYLEQDHAAAEAVLTRALALYQEQEDRAGEAAAMNYRALVEQAQGRLPEARESYGKCLRLARDAGEESRAGDVLSNLGLLHIDEGEYAAARVCLEEAHDLFERQGDTRRTAGALCNLANLALKEGAWSDAREWAEQSLRLFTSIAHRMGMVFSRINLAEAAGPLGDHAAALRHVREALLLCRDADLTREVPHLLELRASSLEATGQPEEALFSLEAAAVLRGGSAPPERREAAERLAAGLAEGRAEQIRSYAASVSLEEIFARVSNP